VSVHYCSSPSRGSESCPQTGSCLKKRSADLLVIKTLPQTGRGCSTLVTHIFPATFDARDYGLYAKSCQKTPPYRDSIVTAKSNE
jgi:hypothetical protein